MKHESLRKVVVNLVVLLLLAVWTASAVTAQDVPATPGEGPAAGQSAGEAPAPPADKQEAGKARKEPRGRLPAYYSKVVTEKQRAEIYDIQAKYNGQIEALQEQLEALAKNRDAEVEGVLTEEQLAEVTKMREAQRTARKSKASEAASPGGN
ncbi:MAG: hypothetical protein FJ276_22705 [Planctomycetes bacterium]|nr:hypothetical protein [Planctomycetota bacterium]